MSVRALPRPPQPAAVRAAAPRNIRTATTEAAWIRRLLIGVALVFLTLFLFVPLAIVFAEAFRKGASVYLAAIVEPDAANYRERYAMLTGRSLDLCPCCGGPMTEVAIFGRVRPTASPPWCDSS